MNIEKVIIKNFKCYSDPFEVSFKEGLNILVGDNEVGKSTILCAIQLTLSGIIDGKYFLQEVNEFIINQVSIENYIEEVNKGNKIQPPDVLIEVFFDGEAYPESKGTHNSLKEDAYGVRFEFKLDSNMSEAYGEYINEGNIENVPIEYYVFNWSTFSAVNITPRHIPIKSVLIDSAEHRNSNGSDIHVNRIVKDFLENSEKIKLTQAHRRMKNSFMGEGIVSEINTKITETSNISDKKVQLSIDVSNRNRWENNMVTFLDGIPFHYIGKGEQCLIKTKLALEHKKAKESSVVLIEEPENHLSFAKLNKLIQFITESQSDKQVILSTHSSLIVNKLGLENLILLSKFSKLKLDELPPDTYTFFRKLPGYDTLRLILCDSAILVEGDSDELVIQRAYRDKYGKLPIDDGIDIISVKLTFLRFLQIASILGIRTAIVTDTDGKLEHIDNKYIDYIGENKKDSILVSYDRYIDTGELVISGKSYNYNTLEPKLLKANSLESLNLVFETEFASQDELRIYMKKNKTTCALKIFDSPHTIQYPAFIENAIIHCGPDLPKIEGVAVAMPAV